MLDFVSKLINEDKFKQLIDTFTNCLCKKKLLSTFKSFIIKHVKLVLFELKIELIIRYSSYKVRTRIIIFYKKYLNSYQILRNRTSSEHLVSELNINFQFCVNFTYKQSKIFFNNYHFLCTSLDSHKL